MINYTEIYDELTNEKQKKNDASVNVTTTASFSLSSSRPPSLLRSQASGSCTLTAAPHKDARLALGLTYIL